MKKTICAILFFIVLGLPFFAASYTNNKYQQESRRFAVLAQRAFDDGDYDLSAEYAAESAKNADLSKAFIEKALARSEAEREMNAARTRLKWAQNIHADRNFPASYTAAKQAIDDGTSAWEREEYSSTVAYAHKALDALSSVKEIAVLPEFYVVRPWLEAKDCFWNISGRPYVYNSPFLWENLYDANRGNMKRPDNPDLIFPGMIIKIPSIAGEYREGMYDPAIKYEPFSPKK